MPKGKDTSRDVLRILLTGRIPSWVKQYARYASLHTADPASGDQTTSEASYYGYTREEIPITAFSDEGDTIVNKDWIEFAIAAGGTPVEITHAAIGTAASGDGQIIYSCRLKKPVTLKINQCIRFEAGELVFIEA